MKLYFGWTSGMAKKLKLWAKWLISPVAIGIYITLMTINFSGQFYDLGTRSSADTSTNEQNVPGFIFMMHQKTIDMRLKARGTRPVSQNLAMLAVDEKAVQAIGRWPWPRKVLAQGIENVMKYGAKVLAFDMVFSEPMLNAAEQVRQEIRRDGLVKPELESLMNTYSEKMDDDKALGAAYTKYADRIVAGSFFRDTYQNTAIAWPTEAETCRDLVFKHTPEAKQWDKEEVLLAVNDPYQPYMPAKLYQAIEDLIADHTKELEIKFPRGNTATESLQAQSKISEAMDEFCTHLFDKESFGGNFSEAWPEIIKGEDPKSVEKFPTFQSWFEAYRDASKVSAVIYVDGWVLNTPEISKGTKHTAYFNTEQDRDGTIRSKALFVRTGNSYFPALSLKAFLVANNFNAAPKLDFSSISYKKEVSELEITNNETGDTVFKIPTDFQGKLQLNYAGKSHSFPYVSFADLMTDSPTIPYDIRVYDKNGRDRIETKVAKRAEFLKDKIFVVGATATGIFDLRVTPFQENFPGAETHLNAIDNMIQKNYFRTFEGEPARMALALGVMGVLLSIALSYLGALLGLLLTAGSLAATWYYDKFFFFGHGYIVAIIWPVFLIVFLYVTLTFYRYLTEERGKKELRQTFQKYVSPAIVEEILSDPKNIELGGKKVKLTVFFSDVRGFTTISEKLDPRALSDLLNSYLTPMTGLVFSNRGTLDKYMGDAIMAFFGAPIHYNDHAKYACRCALQSLVKLKELQQEYEAKGLPTIDIGIGLNTGEVSVGNMGSETVRSYTVMGDAVNLASRLEGINKTYGTRIILSEMTYVEVKDSFVCREVDWVRVKGKVLPVKIYELIAEGKVEPKTTEVLNWFMKGYEFYHQKNWQDGLDCFSKALDINPQDEVSKLYVERCQDYINEPPEADWDGVFVMKTK